MTARWMELVLVRSVIALAFLIAAVSSHSTDGAQHAEVQHASN